MPDLSRATTAEAIHRTEDEENKNTSQHFSVYSLIV
jgi:hypothetical protein